MSDLEDDLLSVIQTLDTHIWHRQVNKNKIDDWLRGFSHHSVSRDEAKIHALYLLSRFIFFGDYEVRALLRTSFREYVRRPMITEARLAGGGPWDRRRLDAAVRARLAATRFLGLGGASESGAYLLYQYRQENRLSTSWCTSLAEALDPTGSKVAFPGVQRYIFIDDFCGTGEQARSYAREVANLRDVAKRQGLNITLAYHVMVATADAIRSVAALGVFDDIHAVLELDATYRVFGARSRYFARSPAEISKSTAEDVARSAGRELEPYFPLGFGDSQLMLAFAHNTPDNTLPIFWHNGTPKITWAPIFPRYSK